MSSSVLPVAEALLKQEAPARRLNLDRAARVDHPRRVTAMLNVVVAPASTSTPQ
jgi:hypothetical protein